MKKILMVVMVMMAMLTMGTSAVYAASAAYVLVDDERVEFDSAPINKDGRLFYPLRELVEKIGGTVEWKADERKAVCYYGERGVAFIIDVDEYLTSDYVIHPMDVAPFIADGKTYLPIRYVAEGFGMTVDYNAELKVPVLTTAPSQPSTTSQPTTDVSYEDDLMKAIAEALDGAPTTTIDLGTITIGGEYEMKVFTEEELNEIALEVVKYTNIERERIGLNPLRADDNAMAWAKIRANELTVNYSHVRPDGKHIARGFNENIEGVSIVRDNSGFTNTLYDGTPDRDTNAGALAVRGWISSPGHYKAMTYDFTTMIGVGVAQADHVLVFAQLFTNETSQEMSGEPAPTR